MNNNTTTPGITKHFAYYHWPLLNHSMIRFRDSRDDLFSIFRSVKSSDERCLLIGRFTPTTVPLAERLRRRGLLAMLLCAICLAGLCQTLHVEPGIGFSGRFRSVLSAGATLKYDHVIFNVTSQYENKHNATAMLQGGLLLYTTRTDVKGWVMVGPSYTWYSRRVLASGEGLRNELLPAMTFRVDYGRATFDLTYNLSGLFARFTAPLFNHNR